MNRTTRTGPTTKLARTIECLEKCLEKPALPGESASDVKPMVMPRAG